MGKLLVVVDYQKDFVDGALGFEKAKLLEEKIYKKVKEYLEKEEKVLFTYDIHFDDYLKTREGLHLPISHCIKGEEGSEIYGKLKEFNEDSRIIKVEKLGFGISPEKMIQLKKILGEIKEIEFVGVVTNICVISNVVVFQSAYRNAEITIDKNLVSSFDNSLHEKTIDILKSLQVNIKE